VDWRTRRGHVCVCVCVCVWCMCACACLHGVCRVHRPHFPLTVFLTIRQNFRAPLHPSQAAHGGACTVLVRTHTHPTGVEHSRGLYLGLAGNLLWETEAPPLAQKCVFVATHSRQQRGGVGWGQHVFVRADFASGGRVVRDGLGGFCPRLWRAWETHLHACSGSCKVRSCHKVVPSFS
jgi:hypothetical protein